jgi:hypothetical protein
MFFSLVYKMFYTYRVQEYQFKNLSMNFGYNYQSINLNIYGTYPKKKGNFYNFIVTFQKTKDK